MRNGVAASNNTKVTAAWGWRVAWRRVATLVATIMVVTAALIVSGNSLPAGAVNDDYPAQWKNAAPDTVYDTWRELNRECTSFVAWRLHSRNGYEMPFFANADQWDDRFAALGVRVDGTPARGAIAQTDANGGHVAWVEAVNPDGTVTIEEYNHKAFAYSERRVSAATFRYIHPKDLTSDAAPTAPSQLTASSTA